MIPKHELLTKEQSDEILTRYNATPAQLPFVLSTDPLVKEIGGKPGDFVKISRRSETAGASVYYRYVVQG